MVQQFSVGIQWYIQLFNKYLIHNYKYTNNCKYNKYILLVHNYACKFQCCSSWSTLQHESNHVTQPYTLLLMLPTLWLSTWQCDHMMSHDYTRDHLIIWTATSSGLPITDLTQSLCPLYVFMQNLQYGCDW